MQKIGKFVIVAYIVLVTAACAVFATLYFVNNPISAGALTRAEAITLVEKACKDRGIITTGSEGVGATSLDPIDYNGQEFANLSGYQSYTLMHDSGIFIMKCLLASNLQENVWYDDQTNWGGMYRYWINGQSVFFEQADNTDYENEDFYPHAMMNVITKTGKDTYKSEFVYQILTTTDLGNGYPVFIYVFFESDKDGAYVMHMEYFAYGQHKVVPTTAVSSLDKVTGVAYYDCNLKTHKLVDRLTSETAINKLSNAEKLEIVNRVILKAKSHFNGTKKLADFGKIQQQNDASILKPANDWTASQLPQA